MKHLPVWTKKVSILAFWLILWQIGAAFIDNHILLVSPLDTLRALCTLVVSPVFWNSIWFSFERISLGFFLAFFAGLITGTLAYWKPIVDEILAPPIHFMKSIPVASFVILALIWTGSENLSVFIHWPACIARIRSFWKWPAYFAFRSGAELCPSIAYPFTLIWPAL